MKLNFTFLYSSKIFGNLIKFKIYFLLYITKSFIKVFNCLLTCDIFNSYFEFILSFIVSFNFNTSLYILFILISISSGYSKNSDLFFL